MVHLFDRLLKTLKELIQRLILIIVSYNIDLKLVQRVNTESVEHYVYLDRGSRKALNQINNTPHQYSEAH